MKIGKNQNDRQSQRPADGRGFTLIELLVVVSIIALLISILLPSLRSAREQAKVVTCMATQSGIGRAAASYTSQYNEWLPGSPGTTGTQLLGHPDSGGWADEEVEMPPDAGPVQVWDWATPLQMYTHLPTNRAKKWRVLVDELKCPSNQFLSIPYPMGPTAQWPVQPMVSYNTLRQFMYWASGAPSFEASAPPWLTESTQIPQGYSPRLSKLGHPADNIFLTDGSRYTPDSGQVDHDVDWNAGFGGGFSDGGPTLKAGTIDVGYLRAFRVDRTLAPLTYRHKRAKDIGIVVSYFDGHGAYMTEQTSRFPDPWWPRGTRIPPFEMNSLSLATVSHHLTTGDGAPYYLVRR